MFSLGMRRVALLAALIMTVVTMSGAAVASPADRALAGGASASCPWLDQRMPIQQRVNELVAAMTLEQKISLMEPVQGAPYPGYEHYVPGIPALCVPPVMQQDDSAGVAAGATNVTQFPAPIAAASTFDPSTMRTYGTDIGSEMYGKGIGFALAPTLNLVRVPQWGRSFETLGEDPYLTTRLGDADIEGLQSQHVIADVKHYAEYNQETNRTSLTMDDVIASERTKQETELSIFGSAVRDAHAGGIMCAMPAVSGTGACENASLLGVLRNQYGFKGDIRSDNPASVTSTATAAAASLDQAVSKYYSPTALESIPAATINSAAAQILYPMFQVGLFNHPPAGSLPDPVSTKAHVNFAQSTAENGTVLLWNPGHALPLSASSLSSIAVIGADAGHYAESAGGGSGHVYSGDVVTPLAGISARAGAGVKVTYSMGSGPYDALPDIPSADLAPAPGRPAGGLTVNLYDTSNLTGTPVITKTDPTVDLEAGKSPLPSGANAWSEQWTGTVDPPVTGTYQFSVTCDRPCQLFIGGGTPVIDNSGAKEFMAHHTATGSAGLTGGQPASIKVTYEHTSSSSSPESVGAIAQLGWLPPGSVPSSVAAAAAVAGSAQVAVVFAGTFESEGFDQPNLNLSGIDDQLISAVAAKNPHTVVVLNTGGPVLMPWLNKVAGVLEAWYPGQQDGNAIASVLFGDTDPGGKLPVTFPATATQPLSADPSRFPGVDGKVYYSEGLDIGYKWYDAHGLTPLFPFGYGLSYTTFRFSNLSVRTMPGQEVAVVRATVTNTGSRAGAEVAQLYLGDPSSAGEPARQLRGFQRVDLAPGQSAQVSFPLTAQDLAYWNNRWTVASGTYRVWVGDSSALSGLPLTGTFPMT